ncbi:16S rRNA (guanine(966)-N(2))-methyltransferase RsmD [Thalassobacter stenotrophicus]|uniref:Ribosomal RNA small subunit methyltransferase D n=2 Tax=Thalassobacter stenotrophicus TaxID=266809 RepID=A0A0P1EXF8_9RHOB|nr:16S rRNA (guanine(966)-N(2))-methyltransferase RsmD [Thalassobacter stenotrophicus]PVZ49820.1 16S rRNA (guanine(966)-N(2))-methyltransferase RsmD [Thalassobacter stenotrophicus]CUH59731.1 Ribosomal RNA small subunit methyltransferase D [Thalassobacter stenotrophicus]SHI90432.1 16S rRNA (guanine966-N2)-methyltransferase [Thalassobacter stenotrophicus DSM 16310]
MRIIGGNWRGRRLTSVGKGDTAAHLRPTTDRTRESLFNLLQNGTHGDLCADARVLDIFAGTGALGLEALSRGADAAVFIENGRKSQAILRENIQMLGADAQVITRDARKAGPCPGAPFDLVFLDPPYGKSLGEAAVTALNDWIAPGAMLVWEDAKAPEIPGGFEQVDQRRYGETLITLVQKID